MANTVFLYDDACPMCKGYTGVFTALNWSDRIPFSKLKEEDFPKLDVERGRHEIPLLDPETGEVNYGLDAMTKVVAEALPLIKLLIRHAYFIAALRPLYYLITYNRRIIAGTKPPTEGFDCAPDYHAPWRIAYLAVAAMIVLLIGWPNVMITAAFGVTLLAGLVIAKDRLAFLGHWVTVLVMVALVESVLPSGVVGTVAAGLIGGWETIRRMG